MDLISALQTNEPTFATRTRNTHPKGWEPGVKFETEHARYITTEALPTLEGEADWREAITSMGVEIPDGYRVRIAEMKYDPVAWTRDDPEQKYATTKAVWRYRFIVEPEPEAGYSIDGIEILNRIVRARKRSIKATGDATIKINFNDTQFGKDAGGGTEATIERLDRYFTLAEERIRDEQKQLGEAIFLLGGDLVEGCSIYPNQSHQIDMDMRGQIRTTTATLLNMLDRLAPMFDKVRVIAVPGNHGENRINGKRVNRHDNMDQLVAESAAMATERDAKLNHILWNIAYDQPALTYEVQGYIYALTHGSVYGKSSGGDPTIKAYNWYKNMAAGHHPVGDANVLVGNHYHHEIIKNFGQLLFIQNPAQDGGSPEFADYSGTDAAPGMATWLVTHDKKMTGYEVLR